MLDQVKLNVPMATSKTERANIPPSQVEYANIPPSQVACANISSSKA